MKEVFYAIQILRKLGVHVIVLAKEKMKKNVQKVKEKMILGKSKNAAY